MLNVNQLYEQLETCAANEERLEVLFNIATSLLNFDKKRVMEVADEILALAERLDNNLGRTYYHATRGRVLFKQALYAECELAFQESLQMALLTTDPLAQGMCYDSLGVLYSFQYRYPEALEASYKALAIYSELTDITAAKFTVVCYNNLGATYKSMDELDKAMEMYERGLDKAKECNEERIKYSIMNNLANIEVLRLNYDVALQYAHKALEGFKLANHKNGQSNALVISGHCYLGKGEFAVAMKHFLSALKMLKEIDYKTVEIGALWGMGNVYMKMEAIEQAIQYYKKALALAQQIGDDIEACEVYALLGQAYLALNQPDKAKEAFDAGIDIAQKRKLKFGLARLQQYRQLV